MPAPDRCPLVFHGSFSRFDQFDPQLRGTNTDCASAALGFFFAAEPAVAISYASTDAVRHREAEAARLRVDAALARMAADVFGCRHAPEMFFQYRQGRFDAHPSLPALERLAAEEREISDELADLEYGHVSEPRLANHGSLYLARLRLENPLEHRFDGMERKDSFAALLTLARERGHDGAVFRNVCDGGTGAAHHATDIFVVFDPAQITVEARLDAAQAGRFVGWFERTQGQDGAAERQHGLSWWEEVGAPVPGEVFADVPLEVSEREEPEAAAQEEPAAMSM